MAKPKTPKGVLVKKVETAPKTPVGLLVKKV